MCLSIVLGGLLDYCGGSLGRFCKTLRTGGLRHPPQYNKQYTSIISRCNWKGNFQQLFIAIAQVVLTAKNSNRPWKLWLSASYDNYWKGIVYINPRRYSLNGETVATDLYHPSLRNSYPLSEPCFYKFGPTSSFRRPAEATEERSWKGKVNLPIQFRSCRQIKRVEQIKGIEKKSPDLRQGEIEVFSIGRVGGFCCFASDSSGLFYNASKCFLRFGSLKLHSGESNFLGLWKVIVVSFFP